MSSIVFDIRNSEGDFAYAMVRQIENSTSIDAEALAIKESIEFCKEKGLLPIIIKADSLVMKKILDGELEVPWRIRRYLRESVKLKHINRSPDDLRQFESLSTMSHSFCVGSDPSSLVSSVVAVGKARARLEDSLPQSLHNIRVESSHLKLNLA
ncbi:hypothetical protein HAX54_032372 [Datura stramonium]|uniref:RNase H type-1 domain-containing protein n=1 Tax=Datura stramonium TaxID=4076 RepID=A0ABS8VC01_DATST|nr:hypothetical protein [Datura stramonium]